MRINAGSKNDVKIRAVREAIRDYNFLSNAEVSGLEVSVSFFAEKTEVGRS